MVVNALTKPTKPFIGEELDEEIDTVSKDVLVIAQEIKIVQALACNDVKKRNKQIRKLQKWLQLRSQSSFKFTDEDFARIWKGLYYNMWMADKPLFQEDLCEQFGQLLRCFKGDISLNISFYGAFLKIMSTEWFGIDQWRMDKFMMLTRRMTRYMFCELKEVGWTEESINLLNERMLDTVLAKRCVAKGLTMHILDIYFEELAKVAIGDLTGKQLNYFVTPFVTFLCTQRDNELRHHCRTRVFYHLLYQSAIGREYLEKYTAWKQMGFPTTSIDDLESDDICDDTDDGIDDGVKHLDPRAGNVDVYMPELKFYANPVIEQIKEFLLIHDCNTKSRKFLRKLVDILEAYDDGMFILGVKNIPRYEAESEKPLLQDKIEQLYKMEDEMFGTSRKLKQLNKRKRKKLLQSLNFEEADEDNMNELIEKAIPNELLKEKRKRVQSDFTHEWIVEEIEIPQKKKNSKKKNKLAFKEDNNEENIDHVKKKSKGKKNVKTNTANSKTKHNNLLKVASTIEGNAMEELEIDKNTVENIPMNMNNNSISKQIEWNEPLGDGEIEYFIPSRKLQIQKANNNLVSNPLAKKSNNTTNAKNVNNSSIVVTTPKLPNSVKRVKIALKHNTTQNPSEYIKQLLSSPDLPYDATKKPGKGLLKPNSVPSPINPFYKRKIGLKLLNDTF